MRGAQSAAQWSCLGQCLFFIFLQSKVCLQLYILYIIKVFKWVCMINPMNKQKLSCMEHSRQRTPKKHQRVLQTELRREAAHLSGRGGPPAVSCFGWQNVGEEHLCQLPQVQQLVSSTAKGHMQVWPILLQGSLLQVLRVLHQGNRSSRKA